jgi:hypothetical protein
VLHLARTTKMLNIFLFFLFLVGQSVLKSFSDNFNQSRPFKMSLFAVEIPENSLIPTVICSRR